MRVYEVHMTCGREDDDEIQEIESKLQGNSIQRRIESQMIQRIRSEIKGIEFRTQWDIE